VHASQRSCAHSLEPLLGLSGEALPAVICVEAVDVRQHPDDGSRHAAGLRSRRLTCCVPRALACLMYAHAWCYRAFSLRSVRHPPHLLRIVWLHAPA